MAFECDICGSCCSQIGKLVISCIAALDEADKSGQPVHPIVQELAEFPYDILENGSCSKLTDCFCSIYETRPLVCRTDLMWEKYWQNVMTREEWHIKSKESCAKLKDAHFSSKK